MKQAISYKVRGKDVQLLKLVGAFVMFAAVLMVLTSIAQASGALDSLLLLKLEL